MTMNVLVNLLAEVITALDRHIHHLRIVVQLQPPPDQQQHPPLQPPQPLQQPQLRVIVFTDIKLII